MADFPSLPAGGFSALGLRLAVGCMLVGGLLLGGGCTEERSSSDASGARPTEIREHDRHQDLHFRAIGQEPGWLVEVTDDTLRFSWAYGEHTVTTARFSKETDAGRLLYRAETGRGTVRVVAAPQRCTDPMNGRRFSHTVTVTLAGDTRTGCGHPLPEP